MKYNIPDLSFSNLYAEDELLTRYAQASLSKSQYQQYLPYFESTGSAAAALLALALEADANPPRLIKYNHLGERQNRIEYHASYQQLRANTYGKALISTKYDPQGLNGPDRSIRQLVGLVAGFVASKADTGAFCPICMTDSMAFVLEKYVARHSDCELSQQTLQGLTSADMETMIEGAMFLTERQGGSDVGANTLTAYQDNGVWRLKGHKWFCSNADANAALVLARMPEAANGTKGLGLFLFRRDVPKHNEETYEIHRLKDKLGVRSMASGEIDFDGTAVELLAGENAGFKLMAEMVNMSRLYNAVACLGIAKIAIDKAERWGESRQAFSKTLMQQPLWRLQFETLRAEFTALFLLTFETIKLFDQSEQGDQTSEKSTALLRLFTPIAKALCGKFGVFAASEAMELIGGNGYIEEFGMAKLLRDAQVLPIWEGTTNIQSLDILRVIQKDKTVLAHLSAYLLETKDEELVKGWQSLELDKLAQYSSDELQCQSRALLEQLGRLIGLKLLIDHQQALGLDRDIEIFKTRSSFTQGLGV